MKTAQDRSGLLARLLFATMLSATALGSSGCLFNVMALPYFLFAGDNLSEPQCKLVHKKKEKKKVVVVSYANSGLKWGFDAIDEELTGMLVAEIAKAEERIEVIPERTVRAWRDTHADWADKSLQDIGEHFDVDYVIFFEAIDFSLNENKNQYLLQGKTKVLFKVHDVNKDTVIFDNEYARLYPKNRQISLNDVSSEEQFRRSFLRRIAKELSWYVVPHKYEEEMEDK